MIQSGDMFDVPDPSRSFTARPAIHYYLAGEVMADCWNCFWVCLPWLADATDPCVGKTRAFIGTKRRLRGLATTCTLLVARCYNHRGANFRRACPSRPRWKCNVLCSQLQLDQPTSHQGAHLPDSAVKAGANLCIRVADTCSV